MTQKKGISKTLLGIIVTALTLSIPIIWDWWSKKSDLTINRDQSATLIEKSSQLEGISVSFQGREIDSLSKTTFTLRNTGRTPIDSSDIVSPITLTLKDSEILDASIETMRPDNLDGKLNKKEKFVEIYFPLLNPDDSIRFSILTTKPVNDYKVESRIKNVSSINNTNSEDQIKIKGDFGLLVYIVFSAFVMFSLILSSLITDIPKKTKIQKLIKNNAIPAYEGLPTHQIIQFIESELRFLTKENRTKLKMIAIRSGDFLDEKNSYELTTSIVTLTESNSPAGGAIIILILMSLCAYYLYETLVL